MTLEQKLAFLAISKPEVRAKAFAKWASEDKDFNRALNANKMSMKKYVEDGNFKADANAFKEYKKDLSNRGWNKEKKWKLIGHIPASIYYNRKEFSPQNGEKEQAKNIKKFLSEFPDFKV